MILPSHLHFVEAVNLVIRIIKLHKIRRKKIRKKPPEKSLKRKTQEDELHKAKRQKPIIVDAIDALRKGLILEIQNVDQKQDVLCC